MKRFLLLLLLSVPVFLLAQSAMSLDDCIRLAYKQNPAVRNGVIGIKETKADYIASAGFPARNFAASTAPFAKISRE